MPRDNAPLHVTGDGRIPLVVGITGHRDLLDHDADAATSKLREPVRRILSELRDENPSSPLIFLSSLAEGADRLAAEVALECGFELIVPLPMEKAEYTQDFKTQQSRDEFERLLGQARHHSVAPDIRDIECGEQPAPRAWLYARAGHYIVRQCHILLALWDGNSAELKLGGTAQMVHFKLHGLPYRSLPAPVAGTVFQVVTPRKSNPEPAFAYDTKRNYPRIPEGDIEGEPQPAPRKLFDSLIRQTEDFNRDVLKYKDKKAHVLTKSRSDLLPGPEFGKLAPSLQELAGRFAAATTLAQTFQKGRHLCLRILCALIVPISIFLAGYHAFDEESLIEPTLWLGGFLLCVALGLGVFLYARAMKFETKHLDYRALAEGLRVLFYWRISGTDDEVARQYMRKHLDEVAWIRLAISASEPMPPPAVPASRLSPAVLKHWLHGQRNYFRSAAARNHRLASGLEQWAKWLTIAALLIACNLLLVHIVYLASNVLPSREVSRIIDALSFILVILLACAGAVAAFSEKMAYAQIAKQFGLMYRLFETATEAYEKCFAPPDETRAGEILHSLGQEALRESADWMLLHRERPMEMKVSG